MKCDKCDNPATVHEVMIKAGKKIERHLCETCARQQGLTITNAPPGIPITQLLSQFIASGVAPPPVPSAPSQSPAESPKIINTCPSCGLGFSSFRNNGLLGCPDCYHAFESQLSPLLARAHEGGTHHRGKIPLSCKSPPDASAPEPPPQPLPRPRAIPPSPSAAPTADPGQQIVALRKRLKDAIEAEQYEEAAKIRDEISRLEGRA